MDIRHWWRYRFTAGAFLTLIALVSQSVASNGHSANNKYRYHSMQQQQQQHTSSSSNLDSAKFRRDIASISVTEVNQSRNSRQTYDNSLSYSEIVPAHHNQHHFHGDIESNNIERNSTDNRKPAFYACKDYAPKVKEEQLLNTFVIKVDAVDPDEYDTITYSFEKSATERTSFRINSKTGEITTAYTFDRDEPLREKEVSKLTFIRTRSKTFLTIDVQRISIAYRCGTFYKTKTKLSKIIDLA